MTNFIKTCVAILALASVAQAQYDADKYCELVKAGTKLPSLNSCKTFYNCPAQGKSTEAICPGDTVFSKDAQGCIDASESSCFDGSGNPCANRNGTFMPSTQTCTNKWVYCLNGQVSHSGYCPINQIFFASTGACDYGKCTPNVGNGNDNTDVPDLCDIMPDGQFFGDFKDCTAYHKCTQMKQIDGNCKNKLVYDTKRGMCLTDNGNMCQRVGEGGVIDTPESGPPSTPCTSLGQTVADTNICSIYYKCQPKTSVFAGDDTETTKTTEAETIKEDTTEAAVETTKEAAETTKEAAETTKEPAVNPGETTEGSGAETTEAPVNSNFQWVQVQCANNQFFDVLSNNCQSASAASPYPGCNRCQFGVGDPYWVNAVDSTCNSYYTCKNGLQTNAPKNSCGANNFFNQDSQYCIIGDKNLAAYTQTHGACKSYSCDANRLCK